MAKQYFKATDGRITVFRASDTRSYTSAAFHTEACIAPHPHGMISFSGRPDGKFPTVVISKPEYDQLMELKNKRIRNAGGDPRWATSPQDSWIRNSQLAAVVGEG